MTLLFTFFICACANADIGNDLQSYFQDLGYASNYTNPAAYQGQQAGYYTGGSLVMRGRVRNVQLIQTTLPSVRTGCSGIDIFGGSLSILNKKEITGLLKNIAGNAVNVAASLALETVTPMIAKNTAYWKEQIDKVNQLSINSCELAEGLVGGAWQKIRGSQQQVCNDIGSSNNIYGSWAEAKQGCHDPQDIEKVKKIGEQDPRYKDLMVDEINVVWKAIQKKAFLKNDIELAEFFMTLSGTLVITKDPQGNVQKTPYPAFGNRNDLIDALLDGKKTTIYHCEEHTKCLYPSNRDVTLDPNKSLKIKIANTLYNIAMKIVTDEKLNEEEQSLIASTNIPIMKILTINSAYLRKGTDSNIDIYAEVIAFDILHQYLQDALTTVQESLVALPVTEELTKNIQRNIQESMSSLRERRAALGRQVDLAIQMITQTQQIERMLIGEFSAKLASTISWAKDLK